MIQIYYTCRFIDESFKVHRLQRINGYLVSLFLSFVCLQSVLNESHNGGFCYFCVDWSFSELRGFILSIQLIYSSYQVFRLSNCFDTFIYKNCRYEINKKPSIHFLSNRGCNSKYFK